MGTNLRPLGDRVIVETIERDETTPGGVVLPETAKEKPQEGRVLAVGPGKLQEDGNRAPMELEEGDKVVFAKYAGTEIKDSDTKHLILRENDVLAVVEE